MSTKPVNLEEVLDYLGLNDYAKETDPVERQRKFDETIEALKSLPEDVDLVDLAGRLATLKRDGRTRLSEKSDGG